MKSPAPLKRLLLLLLLTQSAKPQTVDINTLGRIVTFFDQNYQTFSVNRDPQQYAVAINVLRTQCEKDFLPKRSNFLKEESPDVKTFNPLYEGKELIVARVKKADGFSIHAERLLLTSIENHSIPPMTNLLNKLKDSCTIFYTYKSPCVKSCLNESSPYNILSGLDNWSKHSSVKAFVFKDIFWADKPKENLQESFKKIVARVPLYRCVSENECYACKGEGNTPIDAHCLPPPEN
ncbi:hypothetical protein Q8A67_017983 [Cirrhinus molitorella]|uniref:Uncharacterized protein n=1 Tax=Cirrhinus molitorella TaxID=172907 RepID=A0AA88PB66_9TELE|nr:hypothetical protein Q8A67_017983 [Cirrhinus molitorella]